VNALSIARIAAGIAALFGGALVLHEAKETVQVVPNTLEKLKGLIVPVTLIAGVFVIRALKSK
jgi:hypothetical protein